MTVVLVFLDFQGQARVRVMDAQSPLCYETLIPLRKSLGTDVCYADAGAWRMCRGVSSWGTFQKCPCS